jgi:hypothetical protein
MELAPNALNRAQSSCSCCVGAAESSLIRPHKTCNKSSRHEKTGCLINMSLTFHTACVCVTVKCHLGFNPNHPIVLWIISTNPAITLMFRFSRRLYVRNSSITFPTTVEGCGTRQLWADGLPVAWENLAESRDFHSLSRHVYTKITSFSRTFHVFIVDTIWFLLTCENTCSLADVFFKCDHGCMVSYVD